MYFPVYVLNYVFPTFYIGLHIYTFLIIKGAERKRDARKHITDTFKSRVLIQCIVITFQ